MFGLYSCRDPKTGDHSGLDFLDFSLGFVAMYNYACRDWRATWSLPRGNDRLFIHAARLGTGTVRFNSFFMIFMSRPV